MRLVIRQLARHVSPLTTTVYSHLFRIDS